MDIALGAGSFPSLDSDSALERGTGHLLSAPPPGLHTFSLSQSPDYRTGPGPSETGAGMFCSGMEGVPFAFQNSLSGNSSRGAHPSEGFIVRLGH